MMRQALWTPPQPPHSANGWDRLGASKASVQGLPLEISGKDSLRLLGEGIENTWLKWKLPWQGEDRFWRESV